jgi:hypothetical protein
VLLIFFFFCFLCKYNPSYWIFGYFEFLCEEHSFWSQEVAGCVTSMPHIDNGNAVISTTDSDSTIDYWLLTLRLILVYIMFMIFFLVFFFGSMFLILCLLLSVRIHLLTFLFKVLHIKHPCYLFTLFHFASSARTKNLIVTPHRSLAMGHSFKVEAFGLCNSLPHRIKNVRFLGLVRTHYTWLLLCARLVFVSSGIHWALIPYCIFLLCFCSYFWRRWAESTLILVWCRPSTYRQIVTGLM